MSKNWDWVQIANTSGFDVNKIPEYLYTPNYNKNHNYHGPTIIDLFSGTGGMSSGLHAAKMHPAIAVDWSHGICSHTCII